MAESVAIVTGASQGIGRATALRLAKDFSGVTLAARNADALRDVAAEVEKTGADSLSVPVDLRDRESAETLVKKTLERFGRIDALLNIAGAVPQINLFEMTDEHSVRSDIQGHTHSKVTKFPSSYRSYGAGHFFIECYKDVAPTEPVFSTLLDHGQREKLITVFLLAAPAFFVACPNPAAVYKVSASYRSHPCERRRHAQKPSDRRSDVEFA